MEYKDIMDYFYTNETFDKKQFRSVVREINPGYSESSVNWLLSRLKKENMIISAGHGKYERLAEIVTKTDYNYDHSDVYLDIEKQIMDEYPLVTFQMWEIIQFNEFINHQFAKNLIVVEVENMLDETVFQMLHNKYPFVLYSPDMNYYYLHKGDDITIVVLKLISEAPKPRVGHSSPLEKLLVDIFTNKFTGHLIEKSEYPAIMEDVFQKYYLDETKMFRYARRRNVETKIKSFIHHEREIKSATE